MADARMTGTRKRREILKLAIGAAAGSTVVGWRGRARAATKLAKLTMAAQSLPRTIDPNYDSNLGASLGHRFLFDTLVTAFRGRPEPQLAVSWLSVNPTTWRFRLRTCRGHRPQLQRMVNGIRLVTVYFVRWASVKSTRL